MKYIASVSWGKDSTAMLLRLLIEHWPLDEVVFYNTTMEFQAVYATRDRMLPLLKARGIRYTELKPDYDFRWKMFEKEVHERGGGTHYGYSWCGGACRWGTSDKLRIVRAYCGDAYQYVGIAADENKRFEKAKNKHKIMPLVEWGMTEPDCLSLCYDFGFDWLEKGAERPIRLYDILDRVSCWCCCNKNLRELENIFLYLPQYWLGLKELQSRTNRPMKGHGKSVFDLEKRFELAARQLKMDCLYNVA